MKTHFPRLCALLALVVMIGTRTSNAQANDPRVALRISSLTAEERDALSRDLTAGGRLRIAFACVPAGILILEPVAHDRTADSVRAMAASALIRHVPAERRSDVHLTQAEAEALCAEARNQP